jgi:hypothetical protein
MNLHSIASNFIGVVNPLVPCTIKVSLPPTVNPDGTPVPAYASPITVQAQVQPLSQNDLRQAESLNLQGTLRAVYINGNVDGVVRVTAKGGDIVTILVGPNAGVYLVNKVEEAWPDWCHCLCTLQDGS